MVQTDTEEWLPLARLLRPQGRRGELLAELLSDVREFFVLGCQVGLSSTEQGLPEAFRQLEAVWWPTGKNAGKVVVKISDCNSITEAEILKGQVVMARARDLPRLPEDTYFVRDLIGCVLIDASTQEQAGSVVDVEYIAGPDGVRLPDAAPLLVVKSSDVSADAVLVPFAAALLQQVDLSQKRIVMAIPTGLLETESVEPAGGDE